MSAPIPANAPLLSTLLTLLSSHAWEKQSWYSFADSLQEDSIGALLRENSIAALEIIDTAKISHLFAFENNLSSQSDQQLESKQLIEGSGWSGYLLGNRSSIAEVAPLFEKILEHFFVAEQIDQQKILQTVTRIPGISYHDIRNQLGSINGTAQLFDMSPSLDDAHESARTIRDRVSHISAMTETQMRLIRSGVIILNPTEFDIIPLTAKLLKKSKRVLSIKGKECTLSVPESLILYGDSDQWLATVAELVTNATDQLGDSGETLAISLSQDEKNTIFTTHHDGSPINPAVQGYIFNPFFTTREKRLGLGLYRVAQFANLCGGSIEFLSDSQTGTTFTLTMPNR